MRPLLILVLLTASSSAQLSPSGATASFKGSLPPKATADLSAEQQAGVEKQLATVTAAFAAVKKHPRAADADIFIKAVRFALEFHEWYDKKPEEGVKKATTLLAEAMTRIESLKHDETPWMNGTGQKVLGFYSKIDDSPQPYGVEVPEGLEFGAGRKPVSMWIWLHGRGDTATDLHFITSQMKSKGGQFKPAGTIVIHPFGRYCNGWKSAGETDVFEARDDAQARFNVDENRIALAGFSMGGAGAWHLGAHFSDQWACVHTGAGFVDVKRYQKLTPDKMPPWYEQKLWGVYDVPDYARNFFNVPLISYSGELDAQRDSAEYMMEVLGKEGLKPPHLIGPGMGHKYHPETIKEVQRLIEEAVEKGRNPNPREVHVQTRTAKYGKMHWLAIASLQRPWEDARADAKWLGDDTIEIETNNVLKLSLGPFMPENRPKALRIDGESWGGPRILRSSFGGHSAHLIRHHGKWQVEALDASEKGKTPDLSGPADDAFTGRFIVVLPEGQGLNDSVTRWADAEGRHFITRWKSLMRGDPIVMKASDVSSKVLKGCSVILWGDPQSNPLIAKALPELPLKWDQPQLSLNGRTFDARNHAPVLCYPNPFVVRAEEHANRRYIVLNSGLTFREAHDKTNSLQNPKLPDWAILDITQAPTAESAGKVVAADFFDEHWQVVPRVKAPTDRE